MPELPARPSAEYLRKQAKRLARERKIRVAEAQRALANDYGFLDWPAMLRHVGNVRAAGDEPLPPLIDAVFAGDVAAVRQALSDGANPRRFFRDETPLHIAARLGVVAIVEALIEGGALEWQTDGAGRTPLDVARRARVRGRTAVVALLDRRAIADPSFRAAVAAIHTGNVTALARLLDAEPRLLTERIVGPPAYRLRKRADYFLDPKLFWFVANNPTTVERIARNIVDVARTMLERGVERADLDYTLGLVMTSSVAREQGLQLPLMRQLLAAGATATRDAIVSTAAHWELEPLRALVAAGRPLDAPLAATFGDVASLRTLLEVATQEDIELAFGLAAINRHVDAARLALEAGADINAFLPVHAHSTALHQAVANDDVELIDMLLRAGARPDIRDTLWAGTPLEWAKFAGKTAASAALSSDAP